MINIKRINITLPKKLISRSRVLIDEGLYSTFSELIRESLKKEILLDQSLIDKKEIVDRWFKEERGKSYDTASLSQEEIIRRIEKTRDELWDEKYGEWFEEI